MNENTAIQIFVDAYPDCRVQKCFDLDTAHYGIVAAPKKSGAYSDPFFAVDKQTGEVSSFSPFDGHASKMFDALYGTKASQ